MNLVRDCGRHITYITLYSREYMVEIISNVSSTGSFANNFDHIFPRIKRDIGHMSSAVSNEIHSTRISKNILSISYNHLYERPPSPPPPPSHRRGGKGSGGKRGAMKTKLLHP